MLSLILRPEIKAVWYGPTKDGKTTLILPARILAMHLYTVLQQDIGRKSVNLIGLATLEIREMD